MVPGLAYAGSWRAAALFVMAERTGKGLRGPAKDVLLSDATKEVGHGWGFGLHTAMDQTGAVLGPLLVAAIVAREHSFGPAFLWLIVPAVAALLSLIVARMMRPVVAVDPPAQPESQNLPKIFWFYVAGAGILAGGFVDFPLLAYHFQNMSIAQPAAIPLFYAGAMGLNGMRRAAVWTTCLIVMAYACWRSQSSCRCSLCRLVFWLAHRERLPP